MLLFGGALGVKIGSVSTIDPVFEPKVTAAAADAEAGLRGRFDVVEHRLAVGGRVFEMRHPRSADHLIDDEAFKRDERLPYWAEIWPSAFVLAERVAREDVRRDGRQLRLLELGCGCGLAVMSALAAGFEVTAVDYYADALEFVRLNAELNGLPRPEVRVVDWRAYPAELRDFDFVIAADVLYERDYCRMIAGAMRQSLAADGVGIVTDPQRIKRRRFRRSARGVGGWGAAGVWAAGCAGRR